MRQPVTPIEGAPDVVTPSPVIGEGVRPGGYPSSMEWPSDGLLFGMREEFMKWFDRPEYADWEFLWTLDGPLEIRATAGHTQQSFTLQFEDRGNGAFGTLLQHNTKPGSVAVMDSSSYPAGSIPFNIGRIISEAKRFIGSRIEAANTESAV